MTQQEFDMLRETRDSTIRQEEMIKGIDHRLDAGDSKFRDYESRLTKLERTVGPFKTALKIGWAVLGGVALAVGGWLWDHMLGKKP